MSESRQKLPDNVEGDFFVDTRCIDCSACRKWAPKVFADNGNASYVFHQPDCEEEETRAFQSMVLCPVSAIGNQKAKVSPEIVQSFPVQINEDIFLNGFNSKDSYGADSYFVQTKTGNWMIDSPRFTPLLVKKFEAMGGIQFIFLTHEDDVADADKYAEKFGAKRIIHEYDRASCPDAEIVVQGELSSKMDQMQIIPTPGHTKGHMVLLYKNRFLFTGDHLPWSLEANAFRPFRNFCRSWDEQRHSVEKLAPFSEVEAVFPGHGYFWNRGKKDFPSLIQEAVTWMKDF